MAAMSITQGQVATTIITVIVHFTMYYKCSYFINSYICDFQKGKDYLIQSLDVFRKTI
jgi:hypothetical protein